MGPPIEKKYNNVVLTNFSENIELFEIPTINKLRDFSINNPGNNILYLHTKGVSHPKNECIDDWNEMMLYFLLNFKCIDLLNKYSSLGCNLHGNPIQYCSGKHYSGNFWWATTDYISTLPKCGNNKMDAEFWLNPVNNSLCLHESGIQNPYCQRYPKELYQIK